MNILNPTGAVAVMPRTTGVHYGRSNANEDLSHWKKVVAIIVIIACTILVGAIALGISLSPAVFEVIGSLGVFGVTVGSAAFTMALSFLIRYALTRHSEIKSDPDKKKVSSFQQHFSGASKSEKRTDVAVVPNSPASRPATTSKVTSTPSRKTGSEFAPSLNLSKNVLKPAASKPLSPPTTPPPTKGTASRPSPTKTPTKQSPAKFSSPSKMQQSTVDPSVYRQIKRGHYKELTKQVSTYTAISQDPRVGPEVNADASYQAGKLAMVRNDFEPAFKHFKDSAEKGYPDGMYELGLRYLLGEGTNVEIDNAIRWLNKAYKKGNVAAGMKLYDIYSEGLGVQIDQEKAEEYKAVFEPDSDGE